MKLDNDALEFLIELFWTLPSDHGFKVAILSRWAYSPDDLAGWITQLKATGLVTDVEKRYDDNNLTVTVRFYNGHQVHLYAARETVCERVQVGTRTVSKPDPNAPTVDVEEPIYDWKCEPIMGSDNG